MNAESLCVYLAAGFALQMHMAGKERNWKSVHRATDRCGAVKTWRATDGTAGRGGAGRDRRAGGREGVGQKDRWTGGNRDGLETGKTGGRDGGKEGGRRGREGGTGSMDEKEGREGVVRGMGGKAW